MDAGTLMGLLQAGTEEAWRLQAAEHGTARDGQTRLQNPEYSTQQRKQQGACAWHLLAGTEEAQRLQARTEGSRHIGR